MKPLPTRLGFRFPKDVAKDDAGEVNEAWSQIGYRQTWAVKITDPWYRRVVSEERIRSRIEAVKKLPRSH